MNAARHKGKLTKTVQVFTNDPKQKIVTLRLVATVEINFNVEPQYISFGRVSKKELNTVREVKLIGKDVGKYHVKEVIPGSQFVKAQLTKGSEGKQVIKLSIATMPPMGSFRDTVRLKTDHPKFPELVININAYILGKIKVRPDRVIFRVTPTMAHPVQEVTLTDSERPNFKILSAVVVENPYPEEKKLREQQEKMSKTNRRMSIQNIDPKPSDVIISVNGKEGNTKGEATNGTIKVKLKLNRAMTTGERLKGKVKLITDDPEQREVIIQYYAFGTAPRPPQKPRPAPLSK